MFNQRPTYHLYEGCGNRLLIAHLQCVFSRTDERLRHEFQRAGLEYGADSVLVLTGDPEQSLSQGYHVTMDVFEPRGVDSERPDLPGSWSTMCGNGIRAVARYLMDSSSLSCYIKTRSGVRKTDILFGNQFRVCMGQFTTRKIDVQKYVRNFDFENLLPNRIRNSEVFVGFNGDPGQDGTIDGEPHMIILLRDHENMTLNELQALAETVGPSITTNRKYFPTCINTNFVILRSIENRTLSLMACTFERGVEYVTQACGTGATAIGSHLLLQLNDIDTVKVRMPGGTLDITRGSQDEFYLTGSANPVRFQKRNVDGSTRMYDNTNTIWQP